MNDKLRNIAGSALQILGGIGGGMIPGMAGNPMVQELIAKGANKIKGKRKGSKSLENPLLANGIEDEMQASPMALNSLAKPMPPQMPQMPPMLPPQMGGSPMGGPNAMGGMPPPPPQGMPPGGGIPPGM